MKNLWQDVRYGLRRLRKSPGFTAIALITLAIGIGANTIMFGIADGLLLLRPQGVKDPEQLAYCSIQEAKYSWFGYSEYLALRDSDLGFREVMAQSGPVRTTLARGGSAWRGWADHVSANYFSVLGVTPALGWDFQPEQEQPGSAPVAVLSYRTWQRLGRDPKIVGEFLSVNGTECRVVGVAPKGFGGVTFLGPDLWLPLGCFRTTSTLARGRSDREARLDVVGRLKPGLDLAVAQAQLQTLFTHFTPQCLKDKSLSHASINLRPPGREQLAGDIEQDRRGNAIISLVLMTVSLLILAIACLNLANMLIVQGTARHREIAVRLALGGGRWRIIRQLLLESGLLALLGGALGVLPALGGLRIFNVILAAKETDLQLALNVRVLAATLGLCLLATLLFGLRPALLLSRRDIASEMKGAAGRVLGSVGRRRGGFSVAGQIALAVAPVLSAALLTRCASRIVGPDPRFPLQDKLVVELDPESGGYNRVQGLQACAALAEHLASLPYVQALGTATRLSYGGVGWEVIGEYRPGWDQSGSGRPLAREATFLNVGRDYFQALEIPLLQGRLFNRLDSVPNAEKVAIVDESLARKLRPDGNALGCLIQWGELTRADSDPYQVVGIVAHVPGIKESEVRAQVYAPAEPNDLSPYLYLHVANAGSVGAVRQQIAREIRRFDPRLPVLSVATLAQKRSEDSWVWVACFGARLGLVAGATALFLAALGIYAIKGYMVASRTSEIGIRMALGATRGNIMGMVLREGLALTVVGLMFGLLLGLGVAKVAARVLYGIRPADPVSLIVTITLLGAVSLLAGYLPARRAAKVDPMVALRSE
jgi:putative ABC transport system permease protein